MLRQKSPKPCAPNGCRCAVPCASRPTGAAPNSGHPWPSDNRRLLACRAAMLSSLQGAASQKRCVSTGGLRCTSCRTTNLQSGFCFLPTAAQEQEPRSKASAVGGRLLLWQKSAKPVAPDARRRCAPMPCAAGMARAGPNSRIHALEHADLCAAQCGAARRALKAQEKQQPAWHRCDASYALRRW